MEEWEWLNKAISRECGMFGEWWLKDWGYWKDSGSEVYESVGAFCGCGMGG